MWNEKSYFESENRSIKRVHTNNLEFFYFVDR